MQEPLLGSAAGSSRSSSPRRGPHLPIPRPASITIPSQPPSRPRSPQRLTAATARSSAAAAADVRVEDLGFGAAHEWWHRLNMLVKLLAIAVLMAYFSPAVGSSLPAPYSKISALTGRARAKGNSTLQLAEFRLHRCQQRLSNVCSLKQLCQLLD